MKPLILVGGGGHCKSVIEVAVSSGYQIFGILDMPNTVGSRILDFEVIGTDDDISKYVNEAQFIITVGQIKSVSTRIKIDHLIKAAGGKLATVIASSANVSRWATVGEGSVIMHGAIVNADAIVGQNCMINTMANIEHDSVIGNFCHISTGTMINGNVRVGDRVFLGSQSVTMNGITIAADCVITAGAFVAKNVEIAGIYAGNPVRLIKKL